MKRNVFWGELTAIWAKKEALLVSGIYMTFYTIVWDTLTLQVHSVWYPSAFLG